MRGLPFHYHYDDFPATPVNYLFTGLRLRRVDSVWTREAPFFPKKVVPREVLVLLTGLYDIRYLVPPPQGLYSQLSNFI